MKAKYKIVSLGVKIVALVAGFLTLLYLLGLEIFSFTALAMELLLILAGAIMIAERYYKVKGIRAKFRDKELYLGGILIMFGFVPLLYSLGILDMFALKVDFAVSPLLLSSLLFCYGMYSMLAVVKR